MEEEHELSPSEIERRVISIVATSLEVEENEISRETKFADFALDSLDMVELQMDIEDEFEIKEEAIQRDFKTVEDVINCVSQLIPIGESCTS